MNQDRHDNVGSFDAYLRVSGGLLLLALAAFGRFGRIASWTMFAAGASSVASGVTRYCPITEAIQATSDEIDAQGDAEPPVSRDFPWEDSSRAEDRTPHMRANDDVGAEEDGGPDGSRDGNPEGGRPIGGPRRALTRRL